MTAIFRNGEHLKDIQERDPYSPLAQHFTKVNKSTLDGLLCPKCTNHKEVIYNNDLLKREIMWIYRLSLCGPIHYPKTAGILMAGGIGDQGTG